MGRCRFDEWAAKTIEKFKGADKDRSGWLTPAEYATTAPPPPKKIAAVVSTWRKLCPETGHIG